MRAGRRHHLILKEPLLPMRAVAGATCRRLVLELSTPQATAPKHVAHHGAYPWCDQPADERPTLRRHLQGMCMCTCTCMACARAYVHLCMRYVLCAMRICTMGTCGYVPCVHVCTCASVHMCTCAHVPMCMPPPRGCYSKAPAPSVCSRRHMSWCPHRASRSRRGRVGCEASRHPHRGRETKSHD